VISRIEASAGTGVEAGTEIQAGTALTALMRATHAVVHDLAVRLDHLGMTASEQNVMAVLAGRSARAVGELATATGTKASTLTSVLDRLERRKLLERDVDPADRRSVLITLTAAGERAAGEVRAAMGELEAAALSGLGRPELAGFFAVTLALTGAPR
jgi:MarR family transcriptional regulator, organic hydroperoxide resistance regulator